MTIDPQGIALTLSIAVSITVLIGFFITLSKIKKDAAKSKAEEIDKMSAQRYAEGIKSEKDAQLKRDVERAFIKINRVEISQSRLLLLVKQNKMTNDALIAQERNNSKELKALSNEMSDIKASIAKIAGKLGIEED